MRTIKLEILRHGPRHNQLLSPLTGYLALCENHDAHTLRLPEEHLQLMHRLRALGYELGDESRQFQLRELSRMMGELLGTIPGLMAEINGGRNLSDTDGAERLVHLRLVTSASELALLPFELALAPNGFPGAGQPLMLQMQRPVCLTRETRQTTSTAPVWSRKPRILFAFASPPGLPDVPAAAHLLALRTALSPWLTLLPNASEADELAALAERLTVLPMVSATALQRACASGQYTHVHLLAHGEAYQDTSSGVLQRRYGLALHADHDLRQTDIVDADRLAALLNSPISGYQPQPDARGLPVTPPDKQVDRPSFVSLASCNAGNQGDVAGVGASIAHTLHASGIPFVVASQFPLSFQGSVAMVERLYQGLLWGRDPRQLLVDLRRDLHSSQPQRHDWAALTVYASVPRDFDQQLIDCRITQARDAIDAALGTADKALAVLQRHTVEPAGGSSSGKKSSKASKVAEGEAQDHRPRSKTAAAKVADTATAPVPLEFSAHDFNVIDAQISRAKAELRLILGELLSSQHQDNQQAWCKAQRGRVLSLIASTEKREAELRWHRLDHKIGLGNVRFDPSTGLSGTDKVWGEVLDRLRSAQQHYDLAFQAEGQAWQQVQYLAIRLFRLALDAQDDNRYQSLADLPEVWKMLLLRTRHAIESSSGDDQAWACGDLLELQLLGPLMSALEAMAQRTDVPKETQEYGYQHDLARAMDAAHRLVRGTGESSFPVASTRRQVSRYANWIWRMIVWAERNGMRRPNTPLAKTIQQALRDPVRRMAVELLETLPG